MPEILRRFKALDAALGEPTHSAHRFHRFKTDSARREGGTRTPNPQTAFGFGFVNGEVPVAGAQSAFESVKSVGKQF
jgi:hypothetical protein